MGPENKYLAPPPPPPANSLQKPSRPLACLPLPPPARKTPPPLLGFSIKNRPPPSSPGASDSPFPSPEQRKKNYPKRPQRKAGLGSQSSADPSRFCMRVLQQVFYCAANPSAETLRSEPQSFHQASFFSAHELK